MLEVMVPRLSSSCSLVLQEMSLLYPLVSKFLAFSNKDEELQHDLKVEKF